MKRLLSTCLGCLIAVFSYAQQTDSVLQMRDDSLFNVFYYDADSTKIQLEDKLEYFDYMSGVFTYSLKIEFKGKAASTKLKGIRQLYVEILDPKILHHHNFKVGRLKEKKDRRMFTCMKLTPFSRNTHPKSILELWLKPVSGNVYVFDISALSPGHYCVFYQTDGNVLLKFYDFDVE